MFVSVSVSVCACCSTPLQEEMYAGFEDASSSAGELAFKDHLDTSVSAPPQSRAHHAVCKTARAQLVSQERRLQHLLLYALPCRDAC